MRFLAHVSSKNKSGGATTAKQNSEADLMIGIEPKFCKPTRRQISDAGQMINLATIMLPSNRSEREIFGGAEFFQPKRKPSLIRINRADNDAAKNTPIAKAAPILGCPSSFAATTDKTTPATTAIWNAIHPIFDMPFPLAGRSLAHV